MKDMSDPLLNQITERFDALQGSAEFPRAVEELAGAVLRLFWQLHLNPTLPLLQAQEVCTNVLFPWVRRWAGDDYEDGVLRRWMNTNFSPYPTEDKLDALRTLSFEEFIKHEFLLELGTKDAVGQGFIRAWRTWKPRIIRLTPHFVRSIKDVYQEYVAWLKKHPEVLDKIAWEAFEKLVAEIFVSRGFHVDITGRLRNRSSDIIAIRSDAFGVETRYLIECKRYERSRHIGLEIVNGVIGAARRADVDHAFLVTSSYFTRDVKTRTAEFEQLRLHLRDGDDVRQWLKDYTVRAEGGLWLSPGWDEDIQ